jgi:hypothetical protein
MRRAVKSMLLLLLLGSMAWSRVLAAQATTPGSAAGLVRATVGTGTTFLFHDDPAFLEGLLRHGMLRN